MIDANVIVSAGVFGGLPRELLLEAERGAFRAIVTPYILTQVRKVLVVKLGLPPEQVDALLEALPATTVADVSAEDSLMRTALSLFRDRAPADAPILAAALKAGADAIVTGDYDFSIAHIQAKIPVLSPAKALELCRRRTE